MHTRILAVAAVAALASATSAHGPKSKAFFNSSKANAAVRSGDGAAQAQLYMMQPPRQVTGTHEAIGFEITLRDEEPLTFETFELSYVRYDPTGRLPDESPSGLILRRSFFAFGFQPPSGVKTFLFNYTIGRPLQLPETFGLGVRMPAAPSWPQSDGLSVVAQLNLPGDPNRPRVPAAYAGEVWAFERLAGSLQATPLGGRTLDTLAVTASFTGSVIQGFVRSSAYGSVEDLYGPESLFPDASRGDAIGASAHAGFQGFPFLLLYVAPQRRATPWCCMGPPNERWYLELVSPFPVLLEAAALDLFGKATLGPWPIAAFPPVMRDFWLQGVLVSQTWQIQLSDAIGCTGA